MSRQIKSSGYKITRVQNVKIEKDQDTQCQDSLKGQDTKYQDRKGQDTQFLDSKGSGYKM